MIPPHKVEFLWNNSTFSQIGPNLQQRLPVHFATIQPNVIKFYQDVTNYSAYSQLDIENQYKKRCLLFFSSTVSKMSAVCLNLSLKPDDILPTLRDLFLVSYANKL